MINTILSLSLAFGTGLNEPPLAPAVTLVAPRDAYSDLYKEYKRASRDYRSALRNARKEGTEDQFKAPQPIATYFGRFEALAKQGNAEALLFCALEVQELDRPMEEIKSFKMAAFERLSTEFLNHKIMEKVVSKVGRQDQWLSEKEITSVLGRITKKGGTEAARSEAGYQLARRMEDLGTPFGIKRAAELYAFVQKNFPESRAAKRSSDRIAGLKLAPGNEAPDFSAIDPDGNAFKLSDYRGKVVVLDFWGFW